MTLNEARELIRGLPPGLKRHVEKATGFGRKLARYHGISPSKAALAILVHDMARTLEETELIKLAEDFGLDITERDHQIPLLLHGPVGADLLRRNWRLENPEVLEAISCHTTGRPGMGKLAKVVYLADKLEGEKRQESPELEKVKEIAFEDLDKAMLFYLRWQKASLERKGLLLHPMALKTLDYLENTRNSSGNTHHSPSPLTGEASEGEK